ncbi:hypothetical protein CXG81DRAFT_19775 [Caulochytrium protostelioides]|uniref:ubiquitinyl hydrolase 1 n=1 Tax=Caulochytrium protostelioides TaxID=1555241 RepID=A0A4P9X546_9FUNG|nr:hypothetical protein CXG81DRAFT_19775 [Caulochytrium protostelioides]|eukprot:RKP00247.1 hypothetical protein CXG81DRAFT_19775 [Caulochytrium protostelioides]
MSRAKAKLLKAKEDRASKKAAKSAARSAAAGNSPTTAAGRRAAKRHGTSAGAASTPDGGRAGDAGRRGAAPYPGLQNLGNTCFFNAALQALCYSLPPHAQLDHAQRTAMPAAWQDAPRGELTQSFMAFLTAMAGRMGQPHAGCQNPGMLWRAVCRQWPMYDSFDQQDSHEFLRLFLDGLKEEDHAAHRQAVAAIAAATASGPHGDPNRRDGDDADDHATERTAMSSSAAAPPPPPPPPPPPSWVDSLFGGQLLNVMVCDTCHTPTFRHEPFLDLSIPLARDVPSTGDRLRRAFMDWLHRRAESLTPSGGARGHARPASAAAAAATASPTPRLFLSRPPSPSLPSASHEAAASEADAGAGAAAASVAAGAPNAAAHLAPPTVATGAATPLVDRRRSIDLGVADVAGMTDLERASHLLREIRTPRAAPAAVTEVPPPPPALAPASDAAAAASTGAASSTTTATGTAAAAGAPSTTAAAPASPEPASPARAATRGRRASARAALAQLASSSTANHHTGSPADYSVEASLAAFMAVEVFEGANAMACETCAKRQVAAAAAGSVVPTSAPSPPPPPLPVSSSSADAVAQALAKLSLHPDTASASTSKRRSSILSTVSLVSDSASVDTASTTTTSTTTTTTLPMPVPVPLAAADASSSVVAAKPSSANGALSVPDVVLIRPDGAAATADAVEASHALSQSAPSPSAGHGTLSRLAAAEPDANATSIPLSPPLAAPVPTPAPTAPLLPTERPAAPPVKLPVVLRKAYRRYLIERSPKRLVLHVKRFEKVGHRHGGRMRKVSDKVAFPFLLDIEEYLAPLALVPPSAGASPPAETKRYTQYRLTSVVINSGSLKRGHYMAYCRVSAAARQHAAPPPVADSENAAPVTAADTDADPIATDATADDAVEPVWIHTSDQSVRYATTAEVLDAEAFLLFYAAIGT